MRFFAALLMMVQAAWPVSMMFWNLENFFDYTDGGSGVSDAEFSSRGARHWTKRRFLAKCDAIAKSVYWIGDGYGGLPDLFAMAEVENRNALSKLLSESLLRKQDYEIVHFDSPDHRGIDVALLYRRSRLRLFSSRPVHVPGLETRDILLAEFSPAGEGEKGRLAVLVCHFPSKYGGHGTGGKRMTVARRLLSLADSLSAAGIPAVAAGDFNDVPSSDPCRLLEPSLVNLAGPLARRGLGTIRFDGRWELIDMFMVSPDLAPDASMEIVRLPFLTVRDGTHSGEKPLRTYSGPRYVGGVSDHRPVLLRLQVPW
ncbi:MAG: hypothetical protein J5577_07235 [Bacteroidales bacterium]|nr:hypothetical protein [Bacteroidales bacterium]